LSACCGINHFEKCCSIAQVGVNVGVKLQVMGDVVGP
jgi:hypothetical protein